MRVYEDKNYSDQSFVLEECVFRRCKLKNCDLFYSGGDVEWEETNFETCRFHWRGPAKNTVGLLQATGLMKPPLAGQLQIPTTSGPKPN